MEREAVHVLKAGKILHERYVIGKVLGEGGFGITYRGTDQVLAAEVAIKEYYPQGLVARNNIYSEELTVTQMKYDDAFQKGKERFLKEARALAKFNREPGVVSVTDFFEENNTAYIVMEYLDGITLKDYIKQNGLLSANDILGLMAPVIEALDAVHNSGLIHRDISPDNIMLLGNGGVKLMDFGAARDYTDFGRKSLSIVLKHGYAPEEQYRTHGEQGPWTDIYALCATMYKCITGITPLESLERIQRDTLQSPAELGVSISPQVNYAIMKGLSVQRQYRYQNLREFCDDLYGDGSNIDYTDYYGNNYAGQGGNYYNNNYGGMGGYNNTGGSYSSGNVYNTGNGYNTGGGVYNTGNGYNAGGGVYNTGNGYNTGGGVYNTGSGYNTGNGNGYNGGRNPSGGFSVALAILAGTAVVLIIGIAILVWQMNKDDSGNTTPKKTTETTAEAATAAETATETPSEATTETRAVTLPYTDNSSMDIGACLTTADYEIASSSDGSFSFGYPKYIFNNCEVDEANNYYRISYDESGTTEMELTIYKEANSGDPIKNAKKLYKQYYSSLDNVSFKVEPKDKTDSQGMSRAIISGSLNGDGAYIIAANDGKDNYILECYYPDPDLTYDLDDVNYVVDCIYRYCSFGGTTYKPRTHELFMQNIMGTKK